MGKSTRKKPKKIRDQRLAVCRPVEAPEPAKKALLADDDNYNGSHINGRKSLIEQIKVQGLYLRVLSNTRKYRIENPNSSYKDLYIYLHTLYPHIFDNLNVYGSNFAKIVESDAKWSAAYWSCKNDIADMIDLQTIMLLQREDLEQSTIVRLYDIEIKRKQVEEQDKNNKTAYSEETCKTLSAIEQGLKEFNSSEYNE
jgi:hypothetical protein